MGVCKHCSIRYSPRSLARPRDLACYSRDSLVTFLHFESASRTVDHQLYTASPTTPGHRYIFIARSPLALPQFDVVRASVVPARLGLKAVALAWPEAALAW